MNTNIPKIQISDSGEFVSAFDPKVYLQENFVTLDSEDKFAAEFLAKALNKFENNMLVHEFGGGPSLFFTAAYARFAKEIHFSDYVPECLEEVQNWIDRKADAHDWKAHIKTILLAEGQFPTESAINEREELLRKSISKLMVGDARSEEPIGISNIKYDLIGAHHCLDVAASNFKEFVEVTDKISNYLKPAGWLAISITTGTTIYTVGEKQFCCSNLTKENIKSTYHVLGYDLDTLMIEEFNLPPNSVREYQGIVMAIAQKRNK